MDPKDIWPVIFSDPQNNFAKIPEKPEISKAGRKNKDCGKSNYRE